MGIRTLIVDNYDSYTFNLYQLVGEVNGELPTVVYNDELDWTTLQKRIKAGCFHNIIISPGPGTPARPGDIGVCMPLLQAQLNIPILGVCLGFQALALAHGGHVTHAPEPVHGRQSAVEHSGNALFRDIPSGSEYQVVRYHSLLVDWPSLPPFFEPLAWTTGGHHALELAASQQGQGSINPTATAPATGGAEGGGPATAAEAAIVEPGAPSVPNVTTKTSAAGAPLPGAQQRLLMAIKHRALPHYGVQFHPESVATGYGPALLRNFRDMTAQFWGLPAQPEVLNLAGPPGRCLPPAPWGCTPASEGANIGCGNGDTGSGPNGPTLGVHYRKLPSLLDAAGGSEHMFWELFAQGGGSEEDTFWLDSATTDRGRFSFMGGRGGRLWRRITYKLPPMAAAAAACEPATLAAAPTAATAVASTAAVASDSVAEPSVGDCAASPHHRPRPGTVTEIDAAGREVSTRSTLWAYLEEQLARWRCQVREADAQELPFDFWGGYVGYLGYELKAECGGSNAHNSSLADASLFLADRLLAADHHTGDVYLLAMYGLNSSSGGDNCGSRRRDSRSDSRCNGSSNGSDSCNVEDASVDSLAEAQAWVDDMAARVAELAASGQHKTAVPAQQQQQQQEGCEREQSGQRAVEKRPQSQPFRLREGRQHYLDNVRACMQALHDGESYEVCLTTMLSQEGTPGARALYSTLRAINPAPYAAWLHFGGGPQVCCSSPERFLRMGRGGVLEAKPIKGTAPRSSDPVADEKVAAELAASEKDRAENLMIVDLLRNDLGRVCEPGSVYVPGLMEIESYATVHQMVSTVRGQRRQGCSAVDCIKAAFPGGSMTGAPKIRTMEIIDKLEGGPRGIYSGSIGYLSLNETFDLNIVIRTAVLHGGRITIGAGGAIVVQSDPQGEYDEMLLKAKALLRAVGMCQGGSEPAAVDVA